jgi:hypothetical protein
MVTGKGKLLYGTTRARKQFAMWPSRASERPVAPPWLCRTGAIPARPGGRACQTHHVAEPTPNGAGALCKVVTVLSTRLIPYLSRMTSETEGSDRNRQESESAGQHAFSVSAAGHRLGPEHPLKVETRVRTPLGLPRKPQVRTPDPLGAVEEVRTRPAFVPRPLRTRRDIRTRSDPRMDGPAPSSARHIPPQPLATLL